MQIVALIFVMALMGWGVWLIVRSRTPGRGYPACGGCGYDVSGSIGSVVRCPECGAAFAEVGILPAKPGRRNLHWIVAGFALIVVVVGLLGTGFSYAMARRAAAERQQALAQRLLLQQQLAPTLQAGMQDDGSELDPDAADLEEAGDE